MIVSRPLAGVNTLSRCHGLLTYRSALVDRGIPYRQKNDIRTSYSLRCLLDGRRRWASMPKAMEPGARRSVSRWTRWCGWLPSLRTLPDLTGLLLRFPPHLLLRHSSRSLFVFLYGGTDYCWCVLPCCLHSSTMALTLAPFSERSPSLMGHFVGVYFAPNDASGSAPMGASSLGRVATA